MLRVRTACLFAAKGFSIIRNFFATSSWKHSSLRRPRDLAKFWKFVCSVYESHITSLCLVLTSLGFTRSRSAAGHNLHELSGRKNSES